MPQESSSGPVFVVGIWRSGTSLLYALLNQHPQLSLMYESDLLLLPGLFKNGHSRKDWKQRWDFWNGGYSRHKLETKSIPDDLPSMASAIEQVCKAYADGPIWGCKSPDYYDRLEQLADIFPSARFIVIWRDPAGTCRSIVRASKKSRWFGKRGILVRALLGNREMKRGCNALVARGYQIHQLQYEELVRDPVGNMTSICNFLRIPYEPKMGSLDGADRSAIFAEDHHSQVKSEKIIAHTKRPEVLPPRMLGKIQRYVNYWRHQSSGAWPVDSKSTDTTEEPSAFEIACDTAAFGWFRAWDHLVARLYCFAPLSLLGAYRKAMNRLRSVDQQSSSVLDPSTPSTQLEPRPPL